MPSGVDLTSDPMSVPASRALMLINWYFDHAGVIRQAAGLSQAVTPTANPIDGFVYYYGATVINGEAGIPGSTLPTTITTDVILLIVNGTLLVAAPPYSPIYNPPISWPVNPQYPSGLVLPTTPPNTANYYAFTIGSRIRSVTLGSEVIFVSKKGMQPVRFRYLNATSEYGNLPTGSYVLAQCGLNAPPAPVLFLASQSGSGLGQGTYQYYCTYGDEMGRESSPSPVTSITTSGTNTQKVQIELFTTPTGGTTPLYPPDAQMQVVNIYRTALNSEVFYRIAQIGFQYGVTNSAGAQNASIASQAGAAYTLSTFAYIPVYNDFFYNVANSLTGITYNYDLASDTFIQTQPLGPNFSEYDVPEPASMICTHQNKVWMNVLADNSLIQGSCTLAPTQYTLVPGDPIIATDGVQLEIGTDQGDPVNGFLSLGNLLDVFKRRTNWFLMGDNVSNFILRPEGVRGCIAPDSAVRCNDMGLFLSDDGIYAISYNATSGLGVNKISKEIENDLLSNYQSDLENAFAIFAYNTYFLFVKTTCYFYMFDANGGNGGWGLAQYGTGTVTLASGPINSTINTSNQYPYPGVGGPGEPISVTTPIYTVTPPPLGPVIPNQPPPASPPAPSNACDSSVPFTLTTNPTQAFTITIPSNPRGYSLATTWVYAGSGTVGTAYWDIETLNSSQTIPLLPAQSTGYTVGTMMTAVGNGQLNDINALALAGGGTLDGYFIYGPVGGISTCTVTELCLNLVSN